MLAHAEAVITDLGRSIYMGWVDYPIAQLDLPGPRLAAPDGDATIPAELPSVRFATRHGYAIGQLERSSALEIDGPCR